MYSSQIDFFPDGATANVTETKGYTLVSLIRFPFVQMWFTGTPTFTLKVNGRLRKERVTDLADAPPWQELLSMTEATSAADRLVALPKRADEIQVVISGWSGTGKVFCLVSGDNMGGQR